MGAAVSSNVAQATSEVSNSISSSTTVNSTQLNNQRQNTRLWNCIINLSGDFNWDAIQTTDIKNQQITKVNNQSSLDNKIQQSVLQSAISKIGSLGIGFASASNSASTFCTVTNAVMYAVSQSASQFNSQSSSFDCTNSTIIARNLNIHFSTSSEFYNQQILENSSVTTITNDISQSISQKASATVEGLAGFLIGLALVIAAVGYALAKPFTTGAFKMIIAVVIVIVLIGIVISLYIKKAPPFFNEPMYCAIYSNIKPEGCEECINPAMRTIEVKSAPIKYLFGLTDANNNPHGIAGGANLLGMAAIASSGALANNAGFTITGLDAINRSLQELQNFGVGIYTSKLAKKIASQSSILSDMLKVEIPNLLTNPALPVTKSYIKIPDQFILAKGSDAGSVGIFTPGSVRYSSTGTESNPERWSGPPEYETDIYWKDNQGNTGPIMTPIPLFGLANPNFLVKDVGVLKWIKDINNIDSYGPIGHAYIRFVLLYILNNGMQGGAKVDLNVFQIPEELVYFKREDSNTWEIDIAANTEITKYCQYYQGNSTPDFSNGNNGAGTMELMLGICNNREYKVSQFFKKIGIWIMIGIIIVLVILVILYTKRARKNNSK